MKPSISTFGGNPVSMAAANKTIEIMSEKNIPKIAGEKGRKVKDFLSGLYERFSHIGEVRGRGLMWGLELVKDRKSKAPDPEFAVKLLEESKKLGLLMGKGGLYGNVIRMAPSMLIDDSDLDDGLKILEKALINCQKA